MRVIIDIAHPAQLNFLKHALSRLRQEHRVHVSYLKRGMLPDIIRQEFHEYDLVCIGEHRGSVASILYHANLLRLVKFIRYIYLNHIEVGVNGGVPLGFALKLLGRRHVQFNDDIERKLTIFLERISSDRLVVFPDFIVLPKYQKMKNLSFVNALKEWAYLSPSQFTPDPSIPQAFNLSQGRYIFLREVSNKTFNYMGQETGLICKYQESIVSIGLQVVLSLEDKTTRALYPNDWLILEEPVQGIHSIMYYARFVVSSGDSMAREGAMLGVDSIYCGMRDMIANRYLARYGLFHWVRNEKDLKQILAEAGKCDRELYRNNLLNTWIDVNDLIVSTINSQNRR